MEVSELEVYPFVGFLYERIKICPVLKESINLVTRFTIVRSNVKK